MTSLLSAPRTALTFRVLEPGFDGEATLSLRYQITGPEGAVLAEFDETVVLPGEAVAERDEAEFTRISRLLALAASASYYKSCIPATVEVPGGLSAAERRFLVELTRQGLAEFAYRNDVPEALHPRIVAPELPETPAARRTDAPPRRPLIAVGGGKDSIVTIEAVRALSPDVTLFSVNEYEPIRDTATHAGLPLTVARRRLDARLFDLNAAGALNGHVPVTAINSLIGALTALRSGYDAVIFSNEASSSFGNLHWEGVDVNHQWSKGIECESLVRDLVDGPTLRYLSFLRPLSELAITRQFARLSDYHPVFTSCNRAFHLDAGKRRRWCGDCPKCRFVFLCLAPFISREAMLAIFTGRDLLADPTQREGFLELLNAGERLKPFECVGEPDECRAALTLLSRHPDWADHPFLADPEVAACLVGDAVIDASFVFHDAHFLPAEFEKAVRGLL
ncbi:hypothetical protein [Nocardioides sp.]|uniref:hypothetical protein n=1 Tax=Nocardioides sp. TaxID=35761 RepID=UPI00262CDF02|nr:hypothetical protein [Nocardioides sp.]